MCTCDYLLERGRAKKKKKEKKKNPEGGMGQDGE